MNAVYITALSAVLPGRPIGNDEMERVLGQVGPRPSRARALVLRSNGIKSRHYVLDPETGEPTLSNAQLAAQALRALEADGAKLQGLELLACGTTMADQTMPSHASMVHGELGLPPLEVASFAGVCLSSLSALKYAALSVRAGEVAKAAACGSETPSILLRARFYGAEDEAKTEALVSRPELAFERDFLRWMLSDGAGAVLLEPQPRARGLSLRVDWIFERSFADTQPACMYAGAEKQPDGSLKGWMRFTPQAWLSESLFTIRQDVRQLNEHIVRVIAGELLDACRAAHPELDAARVDWLLPHYSSEYFRPRLLAELKARGFAIPEERVFTNLSTKGNTGSASIYIILEELVHSGRVSAGQRLLCWVPESGRFSGGWMHLTAVGPGER
jgi:3-oxoacyl-[acyl-carrier-protein] synthase-3